MKEERRLFVAVKPPPEILDQIVGIISSLSKDSKEGAVKWIKRENLHITLKFIGEIQSDKIPGIIDTVEKVLEDCESFSVTLDKILVFPGALKPRIIAIDAQSDKLESLADIVDKKLNTIGIKKEKKRFRGHITLGRVKKKLKKSLKTDQIVNRCSFEVNDILIVESFLKPEGAEYITLKRIKLN